MDLDNNFLVPAAVVALLLLVALFAFSGGSKSEPSPKPPKAKAKKETQAIPSEKKPTPAPKPAPVQGKPSAAPKKVVVAAPAVAAAVTPAPQPAVTTSPKEDEKPVSKSKRSMETPEQREARLKRQAAAKELKKQEAAETVANPVVKSPEKQAKKSAADDAWEVVVVKKKAKAQKPNPEEVPATVPVAAPKPVLPVNETKSITVDTKRIGALIGPKGATLRSIQDSTGTSIQMPKTTDRETQAEQSKVTITGPAEGVSRAIAMLNEISATGLSVALATQGQSAPQAGVATSQSPQAAVSAPSAAVPAVVVPVVTVTSVDVQTQKMGAIIGPKGATLHAIQDATETQINTNSKVQPKGGAENAGLTTVTVSGHPDGVKKAVKAINELATKGYCLLLSGENFQESFIMVDTKFLPDIIGKSGANIRAIQERTGCRVIIPQTASRQVDNRAGDEAPVRIALAGTKEGVASAKQIILAITEYFHHPVTHPDTVHVLVDIPERYYNVVIGTKGSEIRHIQNNFKVTVKIPDRNTVFRSVLVVGSPAACDAAARYIQKLVDNVKAKEDMKSSDPWGNPDEEEAYDEDLMNRYVYSRQNKSGQSESVAEPAVAEHKPAPVHSDRPPGFSPMKGEPDVVAGAVPVAWGPAKQNW